MSFPRLRLACISIAWILSLCTLFRGVFYMVFGGSADLSTDDLARALYVGFKLDLRLAVSAVIPFLALSLIPRLNPGRHVAARTFWSVHFAILTVLLLMAFAADIGYYDYLETRLDTGAFRFLLNPLISLQMVWETYSVIPAVIFVVAIAVVSYFLLQRLQGKALSDGRESRLAMRLVVSIAAGILLVGGLYGKFSYYPLRWSDAYFSTQQFPADLAINPVLNVIDTFATAERSLGDLDRLRGNYTMLSGYLGVEDPDVDTLNFARSVKPTPITSRRPNVVVIMMESFASHLTGFHGNPLDASPEFDRLAASGLAFEYIYTPGVGTAHGIFTMFTGIPDISLNRTASRNPRAIDQHMIVNEFEGYEKLYFLGGSANWANIRALLTHNIDDLRLYEEGSYPDSPRTDVWGISDLHLLEEANNVLRSTNEPFFAFIQLSGNHRPYTIPDDNRGFVPEEIDDNFAVQNGFDQMDGYNSFRFLDHSLGTFIRIAQEEEYFANTIFVLTADNGEIGKVPGPLHREEQSKISNHHAPLVLFGAPLVREPERLSVVGTQMDIMPTIAGAAGIPAKNLGLGRNLLDPNHQEGFAFMHRRWGSNSELLVVDRDLLLSKKGSHGEPLLSKLGSTRLDENLALNRPARAQQMHRFSEGFYDASGHLLLGEIE